MSKRTIKKNLKHESSRLPDINVIIHGIFFYWHILCWRFGFTVYKIEDVNVENLVLSDPIPASNGKVTKCAIGYLTQNKISPLLIKTPINIFSHWVLQYSEGSALTLSFNMENCVEWLIKYMEIWKKVEKLTFNSNSLSNGKTAYVPTHRKEVPHIPCQCSAILFDDEMFTFI